MVDVYIEAHVGIGQAARSENESYYERPGTAGASLITSYMERATLKLLDTNMEVALMGSQLP